VTILISEVEPSNVISCSLKTVVSLFISFGTACIWGIHGWGGVGNTHLDQLLCVCFPNASFVLLSFPFRPLVCRTKQSLTCVDKLIKPIIKNKNNINKWNLSQSAGSGCLLGDWCFWWYQSRKPTFSVEVQGSLIWSWYIYSVLAQITANKEVNFPLPFLLYFLPVVGMGFWEKYCSVQLLIFLSNPPSPHSL